MWQNWMRQAAGWLLVLGLVCGAVESTNAAPQFGPQGPANNGSATNGTNPQQNVNQGQAAQRPGGAAPLGAPIVPLQANENPCPFEPLAPDHQKYLQDLLKYWENSTSQIQRFRCRFNRWDYDPVFGPQADPSTGEMQAATIATGEIKYQVPDKAMYEVTGKWTYQAGNPETGVKAEYVEADEAFKEKWISDGRYVFEFDFAGRQMRKRELPPEMQGKTIADGPIPFIFGAKADKMNERYWIRVITPTEAQKNGEYWLEAYPKKRDDSEEFSRVKVILDKEFLPKAVEIYAADYDEIRNRKSQTYVFEDRKINETNLNLFKILDRAFYDPAIPSGWQMVEINLNTDIASGGIPNGTAQPGSGTSVNR